MRKIYCLLLMMLCLILCSCAVDDQAAETLQMETMPAVNQQIPAETEPVSTLTSQSAVMPEAGTGRTMFYVDGHTFYAGGPVSDILQIPADLEEKVNGILKPGHISENILVRVDDGGTDLAKQTVFFFHAINATEVTRPIRECTIYSVIVNLQKGITFDSGISGQPFISGKTQDTELMDAFGEPDFWSGAGKKDQEMGWYDPYDYLYCTFRNGTLRQVMTVYSGQYHEVSTDFSADMLSGFFGNDAYLLMGRYLDMTPYLEDSLEAEPIAQLDEVITLGDMEINLGIRVSELPDYFAKPYENIRHVMNENYYLRSGKTNPEEFYLLNLDGLPEDQISYGVVMGVLTQNCGYDNWGEDNSAFLPFAYQGLTNESTIEDVLQIFGAPEHIHATAGPNACFLWLRYRDASGNVLELRVDPMINAVAEIRITKFYPNARMYP